MGQAERPEGETLQSGNDFHGRVVKIEDGRLRVNVCAVSGQERRKCRSKRGTSGA